MAASHQQRPGAVIVKDMEQVKGKVKEPENLNYLSMYITTYSKILAIWDIYINKRRQGA